MTGSKVLIVKLPELHADVKMLEAFRAYVCDALGAERLACRDRRAEADACGRRRRAGRWRARRPLGARFGHRTGTGAGGVSRGNAEAA